MCLARLASPIEPKQPFGLSARNWSKRRRLGLPLNLGLPIVADARRVLRVLRARDCFWHSLLTSNSLHPTIPGSPSRKEHEHGPCQSSSIFENVGCRGRAVDGCPAVVAGRRAGR